MKKWITPTILLLAIFLLLLKTYLYNIENPTDFKVQQCFFAHGEDFTDTQLNVIACVTDYDTEYMMNKIKRYYDCLYGEADRLTIILFDSMRDFENYNKRAEQTFYKHSWTRVFSSG